MSQPIHQRISVRVNLVWKDREMSLCVYDHERRKFIAECVSFQHCKHNNKSGDSANECDSECYQLRVKFIAPINCDQNNYRNKKNDDSQACQKGDGLKHLDLFSFVRAFEASPRGESRKPPFISLCHCRVENKTGRIRRMSSFLLTQPDPHILAVSDLVTMIKKLPEIASHALARRG